MALYIYSGSSGLSQVEFELLTPFLKALENKYKNSTEFCALFLGYDCPSGKSSVQIDCTLIRADAIINIELKNYAAESLRANRQGELTLFPQRLKINEGRPENPLQQVRNQNFAVKNIIELHQEILFGGRVLPKQGIDVIGFLCLKSVKELNISELEQYNRYFRITDSQNLFEKTNLYSGKDFIKTNSKLQLSEKFVFEFANTLHLEPIQDFAKLNKKNPLSVVSTDKYADYLAYCEKEYKSSDELIIRESYLKQINKDENILLYGSPGSGKSTLLKNLLLTKVQLLKSSESNQLPCFIILRGGENIVDKIAGELSNTNTSGVIDLLNNGKMTVFFDGLDEMIDFKVNISRVDDFIKLYPKNQFILSMRRTHIEDSKEIMKIFNRLKFSEIELNGFTVDEIDSYLLLLNTKNKSFLQEDIKDFIYGLPDWNPLTLRMAVEILWSKDNPTYNNIGSFYEQYFLHRFTREIKKTKYPQNAVNLLLKIMRVYSQKFFREGKILHYDEFFEIAQEIVNDKALDFIEILKNAEILNITESQKVYYYHASYFESFLAQSLKNEINQELVESLLESKQYQVLVHLSGLAQKLEDIDIILTSNSYIDNSIDCFCNSSNVSPKTTTEITDRIINWLDECDNPFDEIFPILDKYGARICGQKLFAYLEEKVKSDEYAVFDFEVLKITKLGFSDADDSIRKKFRFSFKNRLAKVLKPQEAGYSSTFWDDLEKIYVSDEINGFDLYVELSMVRSIPQLQSFLLNDKYPENLKASILRLLCININNTDIKYEPLYEFLAKHDLLFKYKSEKYAWVVNYFLTDGANPTIEHQKQLIEAFWSWYTPYLQLQLVSFMFFFDKSLKEDFSESILKLYKSDKKLNYDEFHLLSDWFYMSSRDAIWNGDNFVADLEFYAFNEIEMETIVKSAIVDQVCFGNMAFETVYKQKYQFNEEYLKYPNEKVQYVAKYWFNNLKK